MLTSPAVRGQLHGLHMFVLKQHAEAHQAQQGVSNVRLSVSARNLAD
jgi:hypothetical protein